MKYVTTNQFVFTSACWKFGLGCLLIGATVPQAYGQDQTQTEGAVQIEVEAAPQSLGIIQMRSSDGNDVQVFSTTAEWGGADSFTFASPMMMGDEFSMVGDKSFQDELNLVPEQREQIDQLQKDFGSQMSDFFKARKDGNIEMGDPGKIKSFMEEIANQKAAKLKEVLLPHQLDRLRQISLQNEMKMRGDSRTLISEKFAEELGIDEEQKKRIKEKAEELKVQLEKEIAKLREETQKELLGELTSDQRKKLDDMLGEKYEYKAPNIMDRIKTRKGSRQQQKK